MDCDNQLLVFGDFVKGTCEFMCPVAERVLRERENLLHPLERLQGPQMLEDQKIQTSRGKKNSRRHNVYQADPTRIVKAFSRSAAGVKMPQSSDLRPFPVLDLTVSYLIGEVACTDLERVEWLERYNFVADRLRAVRQDMVIQGLPPHECIQLLEPMVRFHVFAGYWLCKNVIDRFDPSINASLLQECIKRLLVLYDTERNSNCRKKEKLCHNTEHMMEALYLLINLGDSKALNRGLGRLKMCDCKANVESTAFKISLSSWRGEFVKVCRSIKKLSPLMCMALALHLPSIHRYALMVMDTAYSSKTLKYPVAALQELLLWNDHKEVLAECQHYGITVENSEDSELSVRFQKGSFDVAVKQVQASRLCWLDETLSSSVITAILVAK